MGIVITQSGTNLLTAASTNRLTQESKVVATRLQDIFDAVQRDLEFIARSPSLLRLVNTLASAPSESDDTAIEQAKSQLQEVFAALLINHPWYVQARLIGAADEGMEVVRVDQVDSQIRRVPKRELQRKGKSTYFKEAFGRESGHVYWSPINLNREHGQITEPYQPMLRVALPIDSADDTPFGIVIINLDAQRVFEAIRSVVSSGLTFYVANRQGDYLYHPQPDKTFGFEQGQRYRIQDDFPEAIRLLDAGTSAVIVEKAATLPDASEPVVAHLGMLPVPQGASEELLLGLTMPRSSIVSEVNAARRESAALILPFLLVGTIIVIWLVRIFIAPLERVTREVSRFAPGTRRPRLSEENRRDEVGQLAQAFSMMAERIERQVGELKEQRKRFQSLFETAPDAIIIIDEDGTVEFMNGSAERLFGYGASEVIGHDIKMLMPEPDSRHHTEYMNRYLDGGKPHIIGIGREVTGKRKDGRSVALYLSIGEFTLDGRRKFTGILHDISG